MLWNNISVNILGLMPSVPTHSIETSLDAHSNSYSHVSSYVFILMVICGAVLESDALRYLRKTSEMLLFRIWSCLILPVQSL